MFLHKKSNRVPTQQLKTAVKLEFAPKSGELRGSYNVEKEGNRLISRYKRREVYFLAPPQQIIGTNGDLVYILCETGVFSLLGSTLRWLTMEGAPAMCGCIYRGDMIISSPSVGTYFAEQKKATSVYSGGFSSMTVCGDRIFGLDGQQLRYTAAGERDGWDKGEMITLPTECDALVTLGEKLYALGNTCYVVSPDADDVEFKFSLFAGNIGRVATKSTVQFNGRIVFASKNGLYQLSSTGIKPIFEYLNGAVDFTDCCATLFDGKYYMSCRSKDSAEEGNDLTLILDLDREEILGVLDMGAGSICAARDKIYLEKDEHGYWLDYTATEGRFVKSNVNFNSNKKKFLDALVVTTRNDLDVAIHSETETRLYKIKGKKSAQKINLRDMGWEFSIELTSTSGLDLEKVELYAHICGEV